MAKYIIALNFIDEGANTSTELFYVDAASEAAATTRANVLADLIDQLSGAKIQSVNITLAVDISGWGLKALPDAGADVERGQRVVFATANAKVKPYTTIPGIRIEHDYGAGNVRVVDPNGQLNENLTQWDDLFTELFVTGDYEEYRGLDLVSLLKNYKVFRGRPETR